MENGITMKVYFLDENNKSDVKQFAVTNASSQVESILTRGLQWVDETTLKAVIIPPHRITKITYR